MDRVSQDVAVRAWLAREFAKEGVPCDVESIDEEEALRLLVDYKPGASRFIWRGQPPYWYRTVLDREAFTGLSVIPRSAWTRFSPDETVVGVARRMLDADIAVLTDETTIDLHGIAALADRLPNPERMGDLILLQRRKPGPVCVMDGNHRATATAFRLLQSGTYEGQRAYIAAFHPLESTD